MQTYGHARAHTQFYWLVSAIGVCVTVSIPNISKPLAVDDPLLLLKQEVHAEICINWFLDQYTLSHPKRDMSESKISHHFGKFEHLGKKRIRTTEGFTTCMEPHRGWTIASSSWNLLQLD